MWVGVRQRFSVFRQNVLLTQPQFDDGLLKQYNVRQSLQRAYWGGNSDQPSGFMVGSWGKKTQIAPPQDVDVFFVLPSEVYYRIEARTGNKQSYLLQEMKGHLQSTYPQTDMRGDGQVVVVGFNTVTVEVVPVFALNDNRNYFMPDSNNGGTWKTVNPMAQINAITSSDAATNGNTRNIIRMLKAWKEECNVPLKSFLIELLVIEFMGTYAHRGNDFFWYDWILRDFFIFLAQKAWGTLLIPETGQYLNLGDAWLSRAVSARDRAVSACVYEYLDMVSEAGEEWQKIFGNKIPLQA